MGEERNTYKYVVKRDGKIISMGRTYDFNRRQCEIQARFPSATIEQVGKKTTWQDAEKWLRGQYEISHTT